MQKWVFIVGQNIDNIKNISKAIRPKKAEKEII